MPFVERMKSFFEQQLEGWGPDELVSLGAELGVVACLIAPLVVFSAVGRWIMRRKSQSHCCHQASIATVEIHPPATALSVASHRS